MMWVSLVNRTGDQQWEDQHSLLVRVRQRVLSFSVQDAGVLSIFITLMLPVEVRIGSDLPQVVADLGMLNSYAGLTIPLIASTGHLFIPSVFPRPCRTSCWRLRHGRRWPMRFFWDICCCR
jgi:sn-glycerol 3-phosphate transport system permease protein